MSNQFNLRLLFPVINLSNYTLCLNILLNKPSNWLIDSIVVVKGFLSLSEKQVQRIEQLSNKTYTITDSITNNKDLLEKVIDHDYVFPLWGESASKVFYPLTDSAKVKDYSKIDIYKAANNLGISTPYLTDTDFPIIAKPVNGTGSMGVKKINDNIEYQSFFIDEHDKTSALQVPRKNKYTPHDYFDFGSGYQTEKFIEGNVVTMMGAIIDGVIYLGVTYDIEANIDEYFVTTKATLPSKHSSDIEKIKDKIKNLLLSLDINNSPFIIDFIISDKIYLIDFAPRIGGNELTHSMFYDWVISVTDAILNKEKPKEIKLNKSYLMQILPFTKGKVKEYHIDHSLAEIFKEPTQAEIYKCKNLHSTLQRGLVIVSGEDAKQAEEKLQKILKTFEVIYE